MTKNSPITQVNWATTKIVFCWLQMPWFYLYLVLLKQLSNETVFFRHVHCFVTAANMASCPIWQHTGQGQTKGATRKVNQKS